MEYNFLEIEKKWRKNWEENNLYRTDDDSQNPKFYCLDMFPYPSGEGLHVGHWRGYVLSDVYSRYMMLRGYELLHPMGWDAFGLPAENAAIKFALHPQKSTYQAISNMKRQLKEMGAMYDWEREICSSDKEYYHWTQWMFLMFYKNNLAYKKDSPINWCPSCKTGLADEEVVEGKCERCDTVVTKKYLSQWFFKITDYAERLLLDLDKLDWPEKVKIMQKNWIGKSQGTEVTFKIKGSNSALKIFTTRPDTLFGATYMVLAPEHPLVSVITTVDKKEEVDAYVRKTQAESEVDRLEALKEKTGVFTGAYAVNPVNNEEIPIWISDYVLMSYGTGAIMAVPAHDERDFEFAKLFKLPIKVVIQCPDYSGENFKEAYTGTGKMINSGQFDGMPSDEAIKKIIYWLKEKNLGDEKINYKIRDWLVSRQRYWGAPIPIIYCENCGTVPVPEEDLPVELPYVEEYRPVGTGQSPLAMIPEFVNTICPKCNSEAKRDTDTISQWVCSSWYFLRYASPEYSKGPFQEDKVKKWLPVDLYVGGIEHAVLHLLYSRFFTKVLHDLNFIDFDEPFLRLFNQGMIYRLGAKMSKSKGNVVSPDDLINKYGTDSLRAYELFIGPPEQDSEWNDRGIEGVFRWLRKIFNLFKEIERVDAKETDQEILRKTHKTVKKIIDDIERLHLNTTVSALMEYTNFLVECRNKSKKISTETFEILLKLLAPVAPHLAEQLWHDLGNQRSIFLSSWPDYKEEYLKEEDVLIVIQINGKIKDKISVSRDLAKEEILTMAKSQEKIKKTIDGSNIIKEIYVPGKLVNLVVK